MSDLISRKAVIENFRHPNLVYVYGSNVIEAIIRRIEEQPTVEAKEVVHGKWKEVKPRGHTHYSKGYAECSSCNEIVWSGWEMNFCPKCGCDMRTSAE